MMNLGSIVCDCPSCGCSVTVEIEGKTNLHLVGGPISITVTPKMPIVCDCCDREEE